MGLPPHAMMVLFRKFKMVGSVECSSVGGEALAMVLSVRQIFISALSQKFKQIPELIIP
jgi:hypothetical protein